MLSESVHLCSNVSISLSCVTVKEKKVKEGDSVTLKTPVTKLKEDELMELWFKGKLIVTKNYKMMFS